MSRRPVSSIVRAALLAAAAFAANAGAATLPSNLMLPDPVLAARGVAERWVFGIKLESLDLKGLEPCRQILVERGYAPVLSKTASSTMPELHFKIEGSKEYPLATEEADDTLAAVVRARCTGTLAWTVTSKPVPAASGAAR
ncbi:hypothetical protein SAMN05428959_102309 [Duganella sp. CF517]|uniref:hypothetical protein n=1 Tax=Duganella sp. CF517 TaxID=1881038 RepID=UPI0008B3E8F7|nr:hypothetical protein [Duganella sp. CF517]SEN53988.1 hypothetical protein SAMN05428959_102309 [Duganella sp. CF517]